MFVKEVYFDSRPFFSADHLKGENHRGGIAGRRLTPGKNLTNEQFFSGMEVNKEVLLWSTEHSAHVKFQVEY